MKKITKGLDIPISGAPKQSFQGEKIKVTKSAIIGPEYIGLKPTMKVKLGDQVKKGQVLFEDKKNPGVLFTAPASGEVIEINRGEKRALQSVVIKHAGDESVTFSSYSSADLNAYTPEQLKKLLVESGLWTLFRTRPFSKVPAMESNPSSFFVNACDTQPLAAYPNIIIEAELDFFNHGLKLLDKLFNCHKFLCINSSFNQKINAESGSFKKEVFSGPHPAGNTGTHIHFLQGVNEQKTAWTIGYQGVISIGKLLATGQLPVDKIISFAGPNVDKPRLVRVPLGACLSEVCQGNTLDYDELRVISGSILSGYDAGGPFNYLGQLHSQVTVLKEGKEREFFGWHSPGLNKFSATRAFLGHLFPSKKFNFTTNTNGSPRAIVPIGSYEKVMPLDIEPTFLLRSLVAHNSDLAQKLGCLELDEEDLALCSFVDPGKHDFGKYLRENLEQIEKEG